MPLQSTQSGFEPAERPTDHGNYRTIGPIIAGGADGMTYNEARIPLPNVAGGEVLAFGVMDATQGGCKNCPALVMHPIFESLLPQHLTPRRIDVPADAKGVPSRSRPLKATMP